VLVRCDPRPEFSAAGIIFPAIDVEHEKWEVKTGHIVRKGAPRDLSGHTRTDLRASDAELEDRLSEFEEGDRVIFRGFLAAAHNVTKQRGWTNEEGDEFCILDVRDLLVVIGDEVPIGEFNTLGR